MNEEYMIHPLLFVSVITFLGSFIGTITGFGTATIMMPIVLLYMPLPQAFLFVSVVHWWTNVWKIILFRGALSLSLCVYFGLPAILFSVLGAYLTIVIPSAIFLKLFGGVLLGYLFIVFVFPSFKIPQTNMMAIIGGCCSGLMAGIIGMQGAVRSFFLSTFDLPKEMYIATGAVIALLIDTARITTYIALGTRFIPILLWGVLFSIPLSFLGTYLGKKMVHYIPQKYFRFVIGGGLAVIGIRLLFF
jgi:uncharacterized protein